jgi:hypothetical protein
MLIRIHPVACLALFFLFLYLSYWSFSTAPRAYSSTRSEMGYYVADNAAVTASLVMAAEFLGLSFYNCRVPTERRVLRK